ncbi:MAG TPA: class I SAM-dependent methyltransferase [Nitrospiria bacterium]|jgi:ubiquinone/menaquinone biosynthesis C-methylase UbiE
MNNKELREKYRSMAKWYDWAEGIPEVLGLNLLRKKLMKRAFGRVLEVAAGTGRNFKYYPAKCRLTAVDMSGAMLGFAQKKAKDLKCSITFCLMDAEKLGFPDQSFDTVVSSLSTCTFSNPVGALKEMGRVCRTDGRILLLEHGRSSWEKIGRWQDKGAPKHAEMLGCHWNREPLDLVREAHLVPFTFHRTFFGMVQVIEAMREPVMSEKS